MKIKCSITFLDGKDRFEKDDVRTVDDERGAYFCANGWAEDVAGQAEAGALPGGDASLVIDNSAIGTGDSNG